MEKQKIKKTQTLMDSYSDQASYLADKEYVIHTESPEENLAEILKLAEERLKTHNEKLIKKAFYFALEAHKNQVLPTGEQYSQKLFDVAKIVLTNFRLDDTSLVCALLSEAVIEETGFDIEDIRKEFGATVAEIVEGIDKIRNVEENFVEYLSFLEQYRKILFSLFKDVRIILIKIAERLYTLRTLQFYPEEKQLRVAKEAMEVFVPFTNRFGLRNIKWEMEDLSFKFTDKESFNEIKSKLDGTREEREKYLQNFLQPIKDKLKKDPFLKKNEITWEIAGRAKHIYSIYNKTILRQQPMEKLNDLIAVRVILNTDDENMCFYVYGLIASIYLPVPETFKDYINAQKQNGYQSLHTAVMGPGSKPVEVQIRTMQMHLVSEEGVAAHFKYKRGLVPATSVFENQNAQEWMDSVREIFENSDEENPKELLNSVKNNLFLKEIHVFTPTNKILTFPYGSTPIDFAFAIHSELGYHCVGAKANAKIVPLDYKMQSGDQIEILTSTKQFPNKEWLKFVNTSRAKSQLNRFFKNDDKISYYEGKELWENTLKSKELKLDKKSFDAMLKHFSYSSEREFYISLARLKISTRDILKYLHSRDNGIELQQSNNDNNIFANPNADSYIINLIIKGKDRPALVNDITKLIIKKDDAVLSGVSFDTYNNDFTGTLTIIIKNSKVLNELTQEITLLNGVDTVDWLEK